jgi:hypothetical protein
LSGNNDESIIALHKIALSHPNPADGVKKFASAKGAA